MSPSLIFPWCLQWWSVDMKDEDDNKMLKSTDRFDGCYLQQVQCCDLELMQLSLSFCNTASLPTLHSASLLIASTLEAGLHKKHVWFIHDIPECLPLLTSTNSWWSWIFEFESYRASPCFNQCQNICATFQRSGSPLHFPQNLKNISRLFFDCEAVPRRTLDGLWGQDLRVCKKYTTTDTQMYHHRS